MNATYNRPAAPRVLSAALAIAATVLTCAFVSGVAKHTYASAAASPVPSIVVASK